MLEPFRVLCKNLPTPRDVFKYPLSIGVDCLSRLLPGFDSFAPMVVRVIGHSRPRCSVILLGAGKRLRSKTLLPDYQLHSMRASAQVTAPGAITSMIVAVSTRPNRQNKSTCSRMSVPLVQKQKLRSVNQ